jgi:hypothetical protein
MYCLLLFCICIAFHRLTTYPDERRDRNMLQLAAQQQHQRPLFSLQHERHGCCIALRTDVLTNVHQFLLFLYLFLRTILANSPSIWTCLHSSCNISLIASGSLVKKFTLQSTKSAAASFIFFRAYNSLCMVVDQAGWLGISSKRCRAVWPY